MFRFEEPGLPPRAEQLAAFKIEKGVGPPDSRLTPELRRPTSSMVATIRVEFLALASRFLYAGPRSEEAEHVQHRMASQWRSRGYRD